MDALNRQADLSHLVLEMGIQELHGENRQKSRIFQHHLADFNKKVGLDRHQLGFVDLPKEHTAIDRDLR